MLTRRSFLKVTAAGGALMAVGSFHKAGAVVKSATPDGSSVLESGREIPVYAQADVVVVGGSTRAVAAAVECAGKGLKTFLIAPLTYLGDDICGAFLYDRMDGEKVSGRLASALYPSSGPVMPVVAKKELDSALIGAGVDFVFSSYATNVLTDADGAVRGVVMSNRSGRQAICAKAVIDATTEASVARMAGAQFTDFKPGMKTFEFCVVGGESKEGDFIVDSSVRKDAFIISDKSGTKSYPIIRYTCEYEMKDASYASLMKAEQAIRSDVWTPEQVDSSDLLWYIPDYKVITGKGSFAPKGVEGLFVLGPCACEDAGRTMRPLQAIPFGEKVASEAADYAAKASSKPSAVKQMKQNADNPGRVCEVLQPLRRDKSQKYISCPQGTLPILGSYDVVVLGGGTAGATAAISAARQGARTLAVEYLHCLGGISTAGLIGVYWHGTRTGFTEEVDKGVRDMAPLSHPRQTGKLGRSVTDWKMEWFREELLKAGGDIWFGALGCGAVVDDKTVRGVVVSTPFGRGVVLSKILIDSTGSADIAIAAGAAYERTGAKSVATQGAGLGKKDLGDYYANNDYLFIDDSDVLDVSRCFVQARAKLYKHYDTVKIPQTRERRRMVGDYMVSVGDIIAHRRYSDTISCHKSSFDTHGMIVDPFFILSPPQRGHDVYDADVPLRALLPKGLDGIFCTGLGASAHRDAMPVIRMQPCLHNQGYAVGYLAGTAIKEKKSVRDVDFKKVQKHLVAIGSLPERVLTDVDFEGYSSAEMSAAADSLKNDYEGLEVLLSDEEKCRKILSERIRKATDPDEKVIYASVLCMLGDAKYASVLRDKLASETAWDEGWDYKGMGQFGMCMSRQDALLIALGRCKDAESLPLILGKASKLLVGSHFSHYRAVAIATESIASPEAAKILHDLLVKPGVKGNAISSYEDARKQATPKTNDTTFRNKALKEIHLARALYRCGDMNGEGRAVLEQYAASLQGHYARHASEILG